MTIEKLSQELGRLKSLRQGAIGQIEDLSHSVELYTSQIDHLQGESDRAEKAAEHSAKLAKDEPNPPKS